MTVPSAMRVTQPESLASFPSAVSAERLVLNAAPRGAASRSSLLNPSARRSAAPTPTHGSTIAARPVIAASQVRCLPIFRATESASGPKPLFSRSIAATAVGATDAAKAGVFSRGQVSINRSIIWELRTEVLDRLIGVPAAKIFSLKPA